MWIRSKGKAQQQGNKYQHQDDNLEFDGEIEDLEHEEQRGSYGSGGSQQKSGEKKYGGKVGFLKNLTEQKAAAQNQANDEMDFILDDPDNLDNLSDY